MVRPVGDVAGVAALDRVVTGVVGDDGDLPGPYARLDGERLVAADRHVLREAEAVLLHQFAAEELGVGQGEGQRRVVEADVGVVPVVQLLVDVPAVRADHLPDHHVGLVGVGGGDHPLQRLFAEVVVRAYEVDETAGGHVQRPVAGRGGASRVRLVQHLHHVGMALGVPVELGTAAVGRSVVDGHDLQPLQADALPDQGVQALREVRHGVVDGDDDGDVGLSSHAITWESGCCAFTGSAPVRRVYTPSRTSACASQVQFSSSPSRA